jgi:hypothetical protein
MELVTPPEMAKLNIGIDSGRAWKHSWMAGHNGWSGDAGLCDWCLRSTSGEAALIPGNIFEYGGGGRVWGWE